MSQIKSKSPRFSVAVALAAAGSMLAACGGGSSAPTPPLSVAAIADQSVNQGAASGAIPVVVHAISGNAQALQVAATAGNTTLLPPGSIVVNGTGVDHTVIVTPDPDQVGSSPVTISVTDATGQQASATFTVAVNPMYASFMQSADSSFNTGPNGKPVPVSGVTFVPDADGNPNAFTTLLQ